MTTQKNRTKALYGTAMASLLLLSGCDFLGKKKKNDVSCCGSSSKAVDDGSPVLLSIAGKPVITATQFDTYFDQFLAANPRLQGMIQFLPNARQEIFKGMVNEEIVLYWAEKNDVCNSAEYQKEFEQAVKLVRRGLAAKTFEQTVGKVSVTESEMKDYYEKHKNPELIVTPGGIKVMGVEFDTREKGLAFLNKAKENPAKFKSVAEGDKLKVREFAPINGFSFDVDKNIKERVNLLKTFPAVILVETTDKKFWVVDAISKEDAKYRSFDEVREGLKTVIEREKMAKLWTEKIDELRKQYDISENVTYFEEQKPAIAAGQAPLSQEDIEKIIEQQQVASKADDVKAEAAKAKVA